MENSRPFYQKPRCFLFTITYKCFSAYQCCWCFWHQSPIILTHVVLLQSVFHCSISPQYLVCLQDHHLKFVSSSISLSLMSSPSHGLSKWAHLISEFAHRGARLCELSVKLWKSSTNAFLSTIPPYSNRVGLTGSSPQVPSNPQEFRGSMIPWQVTNTGSGTWSPVRTSKVGDQRKLENGILHGLVELFWWITPGICQEQPTPSPFISSIASTSSSHLLPLNKHISHLPRGSTGALQGPRSGRPLLAPGSDPLPKLHLEPICVWHLHADACAAPMVRFQSTSPSLLSTSWMRCLNKRQIKTEVFCLGPARQGQLWAELAEVSQAASKTGAPAPFRAGGRGLACTHGWVSPSVCFSFPKLFSIKELRGAKERRSREEGKGGGRS